MALTRARRAGPSAPDLGDGLGDLRVLAAGSRFTVYDAADLTDGYSGEQPGGDRRVTVKTASPQAGAWVQDLLCNEASALTRLGAQPHVHRLLRQVELAGGRTALVLETYAGSLDTDLGAGHRLATDAAVAIGAQLAQVLETAHQLGLVHRDIRPATVLRGTDGGPLLTGWHESVPLGAPSSAAPLHFTTMHTAPELLEGRPATAATDVYGLASTVYELIAGRAAYAAYAGESPAAVLVRMLTSPVRPIAVPDVPLALSDLLTWSMSPDPAQRPPGPAWMAEELRRIARS